RDEAPINDALETVGDGEGAGGGQGERDQRTRNIARIADGGAPDQAEIAKLSVAGGRCCFGHGAWPSSSVRRAQWSRRDWRCIATRAVLPLNFAAPCPRRGQGNTACSIALTTCSARCSPARAASPIS